jgi:hypothetical protein
MSADLLYWLGSTVAQSVVALIAFGAFIGVWRRDAIWNSVEPVLDELAQACNRFEAKSMTVRERVDEETERMYTFEVGIFLASEGAASTVRDAQARVEEYRGAVDPDQRLAALVAATEALLAFRFPNNMGGEAKGVLVEARRLGRPVIQGHRMRTRISDSLKQLVRAGLGAFVLSLLVMAAAEPATAKHAPPMVAFAGFALLVLLVVATGLSVSAAASLAMASFGETGAPSR